MTKILIIGAMFSKNRGSAAMLISAIKTMRHVLPNAEFTVLSIFPELDSRKCKIEKVNILGEKGGMLKSLSRLFTANIWKKLHVQIINDNLLQIYIDSDIIIDLSGDGFTDDYGSMASIASCCDILLCKFLNKPIVIYAQSIGPFKNKLTKSLSKFCLNRVDLLIVRDEITKNYLQEIGITNMVHFTADSAFLLEVSPHKRIVEILAKENIDGTDRPLIGISASQHLYDLELKESESDSENHYISLMTKIVNYLIDKLNAQIVFVPHVTNDDRPVDDRFVAEKIFEKANKKGKIRLINNEYSPEELKGIIGQCDLFIGARMHANIAATSSYVPTLAIAYSHKSYGIMDMLGMKEYVIDFREMNIEEIKTKIDDLWINKDKIRIKLKSNVDLIKKRALSNGELVRDLVENLKLS